jgi:hypothetical protein
MGITADPLQSREHILLSNIFDATWRQGRDLDLAGLIQAIQNPPVTKLGVMDLETFYPSKDRFALAMQLNNLIASPAFSQWTDGVPLDIQDILHTPQGKPRIAIFSIAHLDDAQRMFFVSLLLNQVLGWVRTQSGTTSLRALLYMDEIAGYVPPVANPPSKGPLLTLMKQARAFGVGVVLATQNPVDIDYKGLANAGTWFIGRLQTDRDKARVLDGLEGAAASAAGGAGKFNRQAIDSMLSQLSARIFLMNNVHEDAPVVFETRWALSYLRGPLTRNEIKTLMDAQRGRIAGAPAPASTPATRAATAASSTPAAPATASAAMRPVLPPDIPQYFLPPRDDSASITYQPMLLGLGRVQYSDSKTNVDVTDATACITPITTGPVPVDWDKSEAVKISENDLASQPAANASFAPLPAPASKPKSYDQWKKEFADVLGQRQLRLLQSPDTHITSNPGEDERTFRLRLAQASREQRDALAEKLRAKYAPKLSTLQDRIRRAQQAVDVQRAQATESKVHTALSFGAAILSAFTGRKIASAANISRASSAMRGVGHSMKESGDVTRANENVESLQQQMADLDAQFQSEVNEAASKFDPASEQLEIVTIRPKRGNVDVRSVVLAWAPCVDQNGSLQPAWK